MNSLAAKTSFISNFAQIAWAEIIRLAEFEATYYGEPCDAEGLVSITYSSGTFIELIQPLSGHSIFQDYLDKIPAIGIPQAIWCVNHPIARIVFFDTSNKLTNKVNH